MPELPRDKLTGRFFQRMAMQFECCLAPGKRCKQKAVRAHSIQNQRVLHALSDSGHVMMLNLEIDRTTGPHVELRRVGRNEATTFTGLCGEHDSQLFRPIDLEVLDLRNPAHLFLLAYRSVLREFHAKLRGANMTQAFYRDAVAHGRASPEPPDLLGTEAAMQIADAYSFYRFKFEFDRWFVRSAFDELRHEVITLDNTGPVLAVSSVYSIIDNMAVLERRLDPEGIVLNAFPSESATQVVFSYKARQRPAFAAYLTELRTATGHYQRYLLSKIILANCENLVLSPQFCRGLTDERLRVIKHYFKGTILNRDLVFDHEGLMLLECAV